VLDLGLIYWTAQTHRFSQNGSFVFSGATPANGAGPQCVYHHAQGLFKQSTSGKGDEGWLLSLFLTHGLILV